MIRKPKPAKPTLIEQRLMSGATILKTVDQKADCGAYYTFSDTGRAARYDIVERLISSGKLKPRGDGLFDDSRTWGMS